MKAYYKKRGYQTGHPLVSKMRLELTQPNGHYPLKVARLPIPPPGHYLLRPKPSRGAKNGTRTRDPDLGKVVLYQLSYFRSFGAKNGTRTRDPDLGKVVLYPLSYFRMPLPPIGAFCGAKLYNFFFSSKF